MKIVFDLWVLNKGQRKFTLDERKMFEAIHNFIYDKTFHLLEETVAAEAEDCTACTMAEILKKRISFNGYSPDLERRLLQCFDESSTDELQKRFTDAFAYLN